jgi:CDGSH-type Zn-finger protein
MPDVVIKSTKNGPNLVVIDGKTQFAFCRCGHSSHKPFCDGTHAKVHFEAEEHETALPL